MTNDTTTKTPSHIAYQVRENKGQSYFTRIGAMWPHKDGKGFNAEVSAMPIDGRITFRVATEKKESND